MHDMDKAWLPRLILGGGIGYGIGEALYWLFRKVILPDTKWELVWNVFVPVGVILGLLVVLYKYNQSKYGGDDDDGDD